MLKEKILEIQGIINIEIFTEKVRFLTGYIQYQLWNFWMHHQKKEKFAVLAILNTEKMWKIWHQLPLGGKTGTPTPYDDHSTGNFHPRCGLVTYIDADCRPIGTMGESHR